MRDSDPLSYLLLSKNKQTIRKLAAYFGVFCPFFVGDYTRLRLLPTYHIKVKIKNKQQIVNE